MNKILLSVLLMFISACNSAHVTHTPPDINKEVIFIVVSGITHPTGGYALQSSVHNTDNKTYVDTYTYPFPTRESCLINLEVKKAIWLVRSNYKIMELSCIEIESEA